MVGNSGVEAVANDGGNTTVHFYYDNRWRIVETRDGSDRTTRQWVWGTRYTDEILFMDVNGDPSADDDSDPDTTTGSESGESPADHRYFYHQDRNWNVVAITDHDKTAGGSSNGRIVERYSYTPYGEFVVQKGYASGNEAGAVGPVSSVGNPFAHQGLPIDHEIGLIVQRNRVRIADRFLQRDPLANALTLLIPAKLPVEETNRYVFASASPTIHNDALGLLPTIGPGIGITFDITNIFNVPCGRVTVGRIRNCVNALQTDCTEPWIIQSVANACAILSTFSGSTACVDCQLCQRCQPVGLVAPIRVVALHVDFVVVACRVTGSLVFDIDATGWYGECVPDLLSRRIPCD